MGAPGTSGPIGNPNSGCTVERLADEELDDLEKRRRIGRQMQARLPEARRRSEQPPNRDAREAAELGCGLARFGPVGLLLGLVASVVWFLTRRRRGGA